MVIHKTRSNPHSDKRNIGTALICTVAYLKSTLVLSLFLSVLLVDAQFEQMDGKNAFFPS
jgi:hypothetical protein